MAFTRTAIAAFELANPFYVGATVAFYTVDSAGAKTTTLATLYAGVAGTTALTNPQVLDSEGKFQQPVYIDEPVIATIGTNDTAKDHETGIIFANLAQDAVTEAQNASNFALAQAAILEGAVARVDRAAATLPGITAGQEGHFLRINADLSARENISPSTARTAIGATQKVATTTDNAVVRFNGTAGAQQNSGVTIDDNNGVAGLTSLNGGPLAGFRNAIINGNFEVWQEGISIASVSTTRTYTADMWAVTTGAGTLSSVARSSVTPTDSPSRYSVELEGAAGVTTVDFDQRIEAINALALKRTVTFSAYILNSTGAAFTPRLFVSTPAAADNWTTPTVRNGGGSGEDLQSCPNSAWTQVTWTADISGYTNIDNGLEFRLRIPSGSLLAGASVRIADVQLESGRAVTPIETLPPGVVLAQCHRYFWRWAEGVNKVPFGALQAFNLVNSLGGALVFPVPMRAVPTAALSGSWILTTPSGGLASVTTLEIGYLTRYGCGISDGTVSGGGLVAGNATVLLSQPNSAMTFDARL